MHDKVSQRWSDRGRRGGGFTDGKLAPRMQAMEAAMDEERKMAKKLLPSIFSLPSGQISGRLPVTLFFSSPCSTLETSKQDGKPPPPSRRRRRREEKKVHTASVSREQSFVRKRRCTALSGALVPECVCVCTSPCSTEWEEGFYAYSFRPTLCRLLAIDVGERRQQKRGMKMRKSAHGREE